MEYLLCVPFEHPKCHFPADIKQPDHRVLTSCHKQLTIGSEPPTVCCVLEPCKWLYRLLGERPVNMYLQRNQCLHEKNPKHTLPTWYLIIHRKMAKLMNRDYTVFFFFFCSVFLGGVWIFFKIYVKWNQHTLVNAVTAKLCGATGEMSMLVTAPNSFIWTGACEEETHVPLKLRNKYENNSNIIRNTWQFWGHKNITDSILQKRLTL